MGRDNLVASAAYQPEPTAAAAARRFVRDTLHGWVVTGASTGGTGLVDDAVLLTSELVTNAVVHAGTPVQVTCRLADGSVEVVVSDNHPARLVPEPAENDHPPAERTSGRGLLLPAALASAWGVTYGRASKSVWFRLGLAGQALGTGTPSGTGQGARTGGGLGRDARAGSVLAAALYSSAPGRGGGAGGAADGYFRLLTSTLEAARTVAGADAAFALMPDEDGDLRLQTTVGDLSGVTGAEAPLPGDAWLAAAQASTQAAPSLATVPFVVGGQVTGLLAVAAATPGKFGDAETANLQRLADRWGPPLQRAWLASMEQVRRGRMTALADARGLLASRLTGGEVMELAGHAIVPRIAEWCAVLLRDSEASLRVAYVCHADVTRVKALGQLLGRACRMAAPPGLWAGASTGQGGRWPLTDASNAGAAGGTAAGSPARISAAELDADTAWCFPLEPAGEDPGMLVIGAGRDGRLPHEVGELAADLACRIGIALSGAGLVSSGKERARAAI